MKQNQTVLFLMCPAFVGYMKLLQRADEQQGNQSTPFAIFLYLDTSTLLKLGDCPTESWGWAALEFLGHRRGQERGSCGLGERRGSRSGNSRWSRNGNQKDDPSCS